MSIKRGLPLPAAGFICCDATGWLAGWLAVNFQCSLLMGNGRCAAAGRSTF
jgi:hypothetical protein